MERQTVVIISDEAEFVQAISREWHTERNPPSFEHRPGSSIGQMECDLVIVGGVRNARSAIASARSAGGPVLNVSRLDGHATQSSGVVEIPEVNAWPRLVVVVSKQMLERIRATSELARMSAIRSQLEREASLGRYMLEMRHNLNNALTSILGNSELMLLDSDPLPANTRSQMETIRNMGMRMNEILQRFSSLQKEMQLVEEQVWKKAAKATAAT